MHPYFNPELEAAVLAWTALYEKRQPADARLSKDHIYTWARTRYDGSSPQRRHFGEKAMERITTLVNANKTGGRLSNKKT